MKSKLSGHINPGSLIHRLTYQEQVSGRTDTGHSRAEEWTDVMSLRAARHQDQGDQKMIVMKETEVQDVHFVHRYRKGIKQDMRVVDEDGVIYQLQGWSELASRRYLKVTLRRVDQRITT